MSEASEFLGDDELAAMIGAKTPRKQIAWLTDKGWKFEVNAAKRPVVGRLYARLRLAGVEPTPSVAVETPWTLGLSKVS
ncbi:MULTISPECIES: DUF4224 domain-containing protein [unclassified Pseudomonas]|uniref:DUF4224 domain-containing protein n=1 Tax=unclassified Pseudomonas TaxID=196821 RepID=UPI00244982E9|nr:MULTISPECIES: DUF4224 domain-containing protein [unclassified Pseudomonas]MDG9930340.1 DUF4224 domain-containing protein [Pseudomonas sp. GD04042]MDH0484547.1 DUF4224 domain-containing protein [Pseudomonas sp. GD04015]MDH0605995.1 DUF4224 domain-containing protein [Pseudomonas sp. GD03869]